MSLEQLLKINRKEKEKMRRSKVKTLTGVIITMGIVLVATATSAVLLKQQADRNKAAYTQAQKELDANTQTVYVAIAQDEEGNPLTLKAGTELEEGINVEKIEIRTSLGADAYITEDDLGKPLITDAPDGTPILDIMVADDGSEPGDREYEILVANLMTSQSENDLIDLRIMFPNGEDYTILSKKRMDNLDMEANSFTCYMSAEEIQRMASATVDAYTISGTYIYTVRYTEATVAEETIPTYLVREETLALMAKDPNVYAEAEYTLNKQARDNLEVRLGRLESSYLESVVGGHAINDYSDGTAILEGSVSLEEKKKNGKTEPSANTVTTFDWTFEEEDFGGKSETSEVESETVEMSSGTTFEIEE